MAEKSFKVTILWGQVREPDQEPITYEFVTKSELDAFLEGVDAAVGWLDHEIISQGDTVD
jgi:hypothetical protein